MAKTKQSLDEAQRRRIAQNRRDRAKQTAYNQDVWIARFEAIYAGPKNKKRRLAAQECFRTFCETYGANAFKLSWSKYHLKAIKKMQDAVLHGKKFAFAMPRGSGKTTLCHWLMLWATLCGHAPYVCFIGATEKKSKQRLANFKRTLRYNKLLREDFPEILVLIDAFKDDTLTAKNQKFGGRPTDSQWTTEDVVYPTWSLDDLPYTYHRDGEERTFTKPMKATIRRRYSGLKLGFGAVVSALSIEGDLRGANYERPDGVTVRPALVVLDDPQTRKSAKSIGMVEDRERKLNGDIKYMAGPGDSLGVVMPCTVIYEGDLADRFLDNELHPNFNGERSEMLEQMPDKWDDPDECIQRRYWDEYRGKYVNEGEKAATNFYVKHRFIMDEDFVAAWRDRYDKEEGEVSAIQHAINLFYEDEPSFWAEAQNNPSKVEGQSSRQLTAEDILAAQSKTKRGVVPNWADTLVAYVDISEKCFWWVVVAVQKNGFRAEVVDFGAYPEQQIDYYTLQALRKTLQKKHPNKIFDQILEEELSRLTDRLVRDWENEAGERVPMDAIGIDSSWGEYTVNVYEHCKRSPYRSILYPMKGEGVTPRTKPLINPEAKPKKGTIVSTPGQWVISRTSVGSRLLRYDTNTWKSKAAKMFRAIRNRLSIFRSIESALQVFADQCSSEYYERQKGKDREFDVWFETPGRDNHFWDCLVGCLVLAHRKGARLLGGKKTVAKTKQTKHSETIEKTGQATKTRGRKRRRTSVTF